MLNQIQPMRQPSPSLAAALREGDGGDALDLLLGCHQRIRHFTRLGLKLCAAAPEQAPMAADAVYRYYSQALPLHEADENESVYPRLRAALPAGALAEANQAMVDQHVAIDALVDALLPRWKALQALPSLPDGAPDARVGLAELTARLDAAWREHLELEERVVFPALRAHLSPEDLAAIRAEMMARRKLPG